MKKHTLLLMALMGCTLNASATSAQFQGQSPVESGQYQQGTGGVPLDTSHVQGDTTGNDSVSRATAANSDSVAGKDPNGDAASDKSPKTNSTSSDNDDLSSILTLLFSVVALIVAIMAYVKAAKAADNAKNRMKAQQAEADVKVGDLARKVNQVSKAQQELEQRLTNLALQKQQVQQSVQRPAPYAPRPLAQSERDYATASTVPTTQKKYAFRVNPNRAFTDGDFFPTLNSHTLAILTCGSDGRGTFVINSSEEVQHELLSSAEKALLLIADVKHKSASPKRVITLKPGEVVLQNGQWVVTRKAVVALE